MATTTVNIHEAKTHLSRLIVKAEAGEEVIIARSGKPAVRLVVAVVEAKPRPKRFGFYKDMLVPDDIKKPFSKGIEAMFYDGPLFPAKQPRRKKKSR
jgi:prevent-host-death family protein